MRSNAVRSRCSGPALIMIGLAVVVSPTISSCSSGSVSVEATNPHDSASQDNTAIASSTTESQDTNSDASIQLDLSRFESRESSLAYFETVVEGYGINTRSSEVTAEAFIGMAPTVDVKEEVTLSAVPEIEAALELMVIVYDTMGQQLYAPRGPGAEIPIAGDAIVLVADPKSGYEYHAAVFEESADNLVDIATEL